MSSSLSSTPSDDAASSADVVGAVAAARSGLASVADVPAWTMRAPELVDTLADAVAMVTQGQALVARLSVEVDNQGIARDHGSASTQAYVAAVTGLPRPAAAGLLARGRLVSDAGCDPTRHAWAVGAIGGDQAEVIARAVGRVGTGIDPAVVEVGQRLLIDQAPGLSLDQLKVAANHWVEVIDPDGTDQLLETALEAEERRAREQAMFRGRVGIDGVARFSGRLPNPQFSMLKAALDAIASPRRRPTETDAGPAAVGDEQPASVPYGQRLGLALGELIEHLPMDQLPQQGGVNATLVVTISEQQLRDGLGAATLDTGGQISAGQVRRLACNAQLVPAVLDGGSRVLDLGRARRLFNRHQRLALTVRDSGCVWAGCDRPPAGCEAHHLQPWSRGGPTDLSNGVLLCSFHHHLIHSNEGWAIRLASDGIPELVPPDRIDPTRTPRRHERHRIPRWADRRARAGPPQRTR